jgi:diguanylate cyclase (GGDEF)-like protein
MISGESLSVITQWIQNLSPVTFLLVLAAAVLVGTLLSRGGGGRRKNRIKEMEKDLSHAEKRVISLKQYKDGMESKVDTLKSQNREISSLSVLLPDAVEKLNTSMTLDDLLKNLVKVTERLLQARDVSVFLRKKDSLILKAVSGNVPISDPPLTIQVGEGKIGWIAQKGVSMSARDLEMESNLVRNQLCQDDTQINTKICSPMIYNGQLLGALNIGEMAGEEEQGLKIVRMITSLGSMALGNVMLKDQIRKGAEKDGLTGLHSMQYFLNELRKELSKASRYNRPISICHFSIDSFQKYNAVNGYLAGDEVLRMMSKILNDHLREHDLVARYGGKEFILICPETGKEDALSLAEKLRGVIQNFPFPHKERMPKGQITISGGISGYPEDGTDEVELIRSAVEGARLSKDSGGNRVSPSKGQTDKGKFSIQG